MDAEELNELDKLEALASMVSDSSESEDEKDSSEDDIGTFKVKVIVNFNRGLLKATVVYRLLIICVVFQVKSGVPVKLIVNLM